jgi:adenine-specific DNA-methyltransferase
LFSYGNAKVSFVWGAWMTAEVTRLAVREATPESIRALVRTTISGVEKSFNTVDRLQSRTRLALAQSLLDGGAGISPRFGRPTTDLAAELAKLNVDDRHYWVSTFYTLLMSTSLRREKATYFTPPAIVRHLIGQAEKAGVCTENLNSDVVMVKPAEDRV